MTTDTRGKINQIIKHALVPLVSHIYGRELTKH